MIKRTLTLKLYESLMQLISKEVRNAINEATGFDGMTPDAAERLRRVNNRYASYKSKGGSPKAAAKIVADYQAVLDDIVNPKMRAKVEAIINSLNGNAAAPAAPATPVRPAAPVVEPEPEVEIPQNEPIEEEPVEEPVEETPIDEPVEETPSTPLDIMVAIKSLANDILSAEEIEDMEVDNWTIEKTDNGARIIIATIPVMQEGEEIPRELIEDESQRCDAILAKVLKAANIKFNLPDDVVDTCLYDSDDETTIIYGIDYDEEYA